eukprot:CAMPEP_0113539760 /NCGR_PEP_ID=MMETSP0015_2-20120614/8105_1 /TAXON_ID=2838 /ORGANISM="Odontella" /LENGTH=458 /DNA_ID=CAMNT_0000439491 /DNA_START=50 /DNA_END=1426 /DNA_ORIENTATION=+ /assembly_acc=CAM_ASM_000160
MATTARQTNDNEGRIALPGREAEDADCSVDEERTTATSALDRAGEDGADASSSMTSFRRGMRLVCVASALALVAGAALSAARNSSSPASSANGGGRSLKTRVIQKEMQLLTAASSSSSSGGGEDSASDLLSQDELRRLLSFSIVGFPKTGTSFMEHYLFNQDKELHLDSREHCISHPEAAEETLQVLVTEDGFKLDGTTKDGVPVKNAIKCPHELYGEYNLGNYQKLLPDIKFIVSTRHPVHWFQSWYNYKLRQTNKHKKGEIWAPPTNTLVGPCAEGTPYHYGAPNKLSIKSKKNVCTDGAKFHHALSRFGKTPMNTPEELNLLGHHKMSVHPMPQSKVFIMEIGQFAVDSDRDQELADQFLRDMQDYLGLEHDLPPLYHHESKPIREEVEDFVIDICDDEHAMVRGELVKAGKEAYLWLRDYFVDSPGVVVSNKAHFLELAERWQYDPCERTDERP